MVLRALAVEIVKERPFSKKNSTIKPRKDSYRKIRGARSMATSHLSLALYTILRFTVVEKDER